MPWNDNAGGGGPWGSGGGGQNNNNPWGRGPNGPGRGPNGGGQEPDLEELVRRFQQWLGGKGPRGGGRGGSGKGGSGGGVVGVVGALIVVGVITAASVYQVGPGEAGVVQRFGEYVRTTGAGLRVKLPYPIETVETVNVTEIRSITIGTTPQEALMVTRDENIVDLSFTVQWQVDPTRVRDYVFNVRDQRAMVQAVSESAMREVVGTSDLQPIIGTGRGEVAQRAEEIIQDTLDLYEAGIQVVGLQLQESAPPEDVIAAFQDVISAEQDAEANALQATAYANRIVPEARGDAVRLLEEARGYRDQVVAEAQGQADRFNAIYDEYAQAPDVTRERMYLETMERVLGRSELLILDQNGNGAVPYLPLDQLGRNRGDANRAAGSGQGG
ncbi:MAG: FtsH protease activity modulator HflK [Oceanicaulis sp.]|jgi:membrane protease subunit HflK|uniref:FtsH protease activity modulator HflK n=1 Tax=unclassified Oceanicaulis TaxID=2632123 RepID=UPI000C53101E|nr:MULTISPECIES: FtsH protease activity modulator HflK [unclassified Oceanicaulis]MAB68530.1 FtsH protease activity modulator HflK [Oceanicaulis sp.]MBC39796.1 FtsH protease activity modulator HflK [Oceanicaulis sp.]MBG36105.1 FtsH protease activity modulator HflK [Oceanicaulis sp.]HCR94820.1 FtsH protease activity modulator HflK [Oceanicaulis sp.]|tara:strand:+ start:4151 stop:5305 length:1155 start_codon:yes stop_codon:yes gene_type:complete